MEALENDDDIVASRGFGDQFGIVFDSKNRLTDIENNNKGQ